MKAISLFLLLIMTNLAAAQTENYQTAINRFEQDFNAGNYEAIFNSFSAKMKQALPLPNAQQFLAGLNAQVGKIKDKAFIGYTQGTYATYKTNFERAVLAVNISLDGQNQVNGLLVQPYEEPAPASSNPTINALDTYPKEVAELIFEQAKDFPNRTELSIAVIAEGETQFFGVIKENDSLKTTENHTKVFEVGSITKVFTSTILASLVVEEKIKLNDPINPYYPFTFNQKENISFQNLANHTSGLPALPENFVPSDESNPYQDYEQEALETYLENNLKLANNPTYTYSNLGAGLLGHTLSLSQKISFTDLLQKRVFDKYQMTNSFTSLQDVKGELIKGLNESGEITSNWEFDVLFGAGGILSTAEDLSAFAKAQFDPKNEELALTRKPTFV
ncbi:MAG: serine hydrolase, partial [Bacteroidota bacterium]